MTHLEKSCTLCGNKFEKPIWISLKNWNENRKYCSRKCLDNSKIGNTYRKGQKHPNIWNKGLPGPKGELNPNWKGDKIGYSGIHKWIVLMKGNPDTCEHCRKSGFTNRQIHWANKDHKYKRELSDWIRLCAKCHQTYDKIHNNYGNSIITSIKFLSRTGSD